VAVIEFRRVQDQHQRLSLDRQTGQNLAGERRHHIVRVDQPVDQHPRYPLRAHVDARGVARQAGGQVPQVGAADIEHRRDQQR
jgi:hypothetical protein